MKKSIVTLFMIMVSLFAGKLRAQDILVMKNGDELNVKVTEVGTDIVKYKKYENLQGPTYTLEKSKVFMIRYENGAKDVFGINESEANKTSTTGPGTTNMPRTPPARQNNNTLPKSTFNINALGLIQFGPIFQYEAKIGERSYIAPHFRYAYAGVLTHLAWTGFDGTLSPSTAALGLGIKSFAETTGNTWYYGGILDLQWGTATYDEGELSESEEVGLTLAVLSNVGYRWRSSRNSYLNVGLFAGLAPDLTAEETFRNGNVEDNRQTTFFAMVELSFGWEY
ncbi:MAG: hypothetical protein MJA30_28735 [Cytophagales bacterium]|nr:hypothetical protein [Cytophagales bacterium]